VTCVLIVGIPVMCGEFFIGRTSRKNAIGAFDALKASPFWKVIGLSAIAAAFLIMFFYSSVAGWVYSYVFKALTGTFNTITTMDQPTATKFAEDTFNSTLTGGYKPIFWQFIALAVVAGILVGGVKNGIERATKTMMPILLVLIVICDIRALTLPNSFEGINFLFNVDFSKITSSVVLTAMGLAFFKLSLGVACMVTYSSYFTSDNNMMGTAVKVAFADTTVSLLAGVAIFPVVFSFGLQPGAGPGLLFQTIPLVFSQMPFGNVLLVAFFLLTGMAATMAMISIVEIVVVILNEQLNMSRKKAVLITCSMIFAVGAFTVHPTSGIGGTVIHTGALFGDNSFFDLFDNLSSKIFMPIGGLLVALFVGHFYDGKKVFASLTNGETVNVAVFKVFYFIIRFITPVIIVIIFLNGLGVFR
jgi:neurotransmitter:Na+ symporter, NSS family